MNIVLMGAPGSGKGTQANRLSALLRIPHISTGEMLRSEISLGTPLALQVQKYVDLGEYVPDDLITGLALTRLDEPDALKGFILDGFPRTVPQAISLDTVLEAQHRQIDAAIDITAPTEVLMSRLLGREASERRVDDVPAVIRTRLEVYKRLTHPVLAYYRQQGKLAEIDGTQSVAAVSKQIDTALSLLRSTSS